VTVRVVASPTVQASSDTTVYPGDPMLLQAFGSPDVVQYGWTPGRYLDCPTCASTSAKPLEPMAYVVTVANAAACTSTDTVHVSLLCSESRIFIPNMFTPNGDGLNDKFSVIAQGVTSIRHFRVFNRFGELVFERKDFQPNDPAGAWNGSFKGILQPVGTYVWMADMECKGQVYTRKGTVVLDY
jgi:gliding motility-associated-like protein